MASLSPLEGRMCFVVGARRSGTLWLQRIVDAHPRVSSVPTETYLFSYGISQVFDRIQHGLVGSPRVASVYAERDPVVAAARELCDAIFAPFAAADDALLIERTPWHAHHLDLIGEIYPDARLLHIVRDGRDVARSLHAQPWGPETLIEAAGEWREAVLAARAGAAGNPRYRELRYEALLADPEREIGELYEWLGLPDASAEVEKGLAAARERANVGAAPSLGEARWRREWSETDLREFESVAGELLDDLGYERMGTDPAPVQRPPAARRERDDDRTEGGRERPPVPERPASEMLRPQQLVEEVIAALRPDATDALAPNLAAGATVRVLAPDRDEKASGAQALELLRQEIDRDPAFSGRQVLGKSFPAVPQTTVALGFELEDGSLESRTILIATAEGLVSELTLLVPPSPAPQRQ